MATHAQRRAAQQARAAAAEARLEGERSHRRRVALLAVGLVTLVLVVGTAYLVNQERRLDDLDARSVATGCTRDTRSDPAGEGDHVPAPTYAVDPPAGGSHTAEWATSGVYGPGGEPVPADGLLVHALEHGYVVVWYRPTVDVAVRERLAALVRDAAPDALLVPRASLGVDVAATAWGHRLLCATSEQAGDAALRAFLERRAGKGPEKVDRT